MKTARQVAEQSGQTVHVYYNEQTKQGSLRLYRLVELVKFTRSRCTLVKTSRLVCCVENKWAEPLCNGCYGNLLRTLKKQSAA